MRSVEFYPFFIFIQVVTEGISVEYQLHAYQQSGLHSDQD